MMSMAEEELLEIYSDKDAPLFERKLARVIHTSQWKEIEAMINQVYGTPKQSIEYRDVELKPILPKPKNTAQKRQGK
jgi:hypothetical protein